MFCVIQHYDDGVLVYRLYTGYRYEYSHHIEYKMEEFIYKAQVFIYVYTCVIALLFGWVIAIIISIQMFINLYSVLRSLCVLI